jgi:multidrug efflux pump subunit AcrB
MDLWSGPWHATIGDKVATLPHGSVRIIDAMWIVRVALRRPYTFVVLALLILMVGPFTIARTPTDIFPNINIPVVAVIWNYGGLSAEEMSTRIVSIYERNLTTTVNDIEHVESQSLRGIAIVKVFLQPGAKIDLALAQVTGSAQSALRQLPPGTQPPFVVTFNASTVPVLQLALSGKKLSEQQLFDLGVNFLRTQLASVAGAQIPYPYGGKQPQIQVDLMPEAMQAKHLSPADVVNAISAQNLILPSGTQKIGGTEYDVDLNASPRTIDELNNLPIKTVGESTIYIHDVAHVRDGFPPQTNIVRVDGLRASLVTIQKVGNASTLDIIRNVKEALPRIQAGLPPDLDIKPLADQSLFVQASITGVLREALIAACLTALMILVFLGSWRSTVIIAVSIPLSILTSIIVLSAIGETINIMTLGGLALAVGILVDDATVAIENINSQLEQGKDLEPSILEGAEQIAIPAFVSTICICIVFVPMFFLTGVARYLFVPMAEAVVFAMLASYALSRTLVPTMATYLLRAHEPHGSVGAARSRNPLVRLQRAIDSGFVRMRDAYRGLLERSVGSRRVFAAVFLGGCVASLVLVRWVGEDFFPAVDGGQFKLHLRAPSGTRIEETAILCDHVEAALHDVIPVRELAGIIDNIGLPYSGLNLSYSTSAPIGPGDADIQVALGQGHRPTAEYIHDLRMMLPGRFPGVIFSFAPADIVTQTLNFGLPAPIDIQIVGRNLAANRAFASRLTTRLAQVPGIADLRVHQEFNQPRLHLEIDRTRAGQIGLTQRDVANNLLISLSGSSQTTPTWWLNPNTGVSYAIATQTPQYRVASLQDLGNIPVTSSGASRQQTLQALTTVTRDSAALVASHYNVQPVIDIYGAVQGRDLGSVSREVSPILASSEQNLPRGSQIIVRGQIETMTSSFIGLLAGLALAIVLVYLLIVVNFQSWLDPLIIISALPAALAGIVWLLFLSHTTFSVPSLTGAIMCMGVATANSILVVSFAKDELGRGVPAATAAIEAGFGRFRPVLMTALAMIIGMVPMALGFGEGGEQNAPLGRAVIGGLTLATVATLFFVPSVFALLHGRAGLDTTSAHAATGVDGQ